MSFFSDDNSDEFPETLPVESSNNFLSNFLESANDNETSHKEFVSCVHLNSSDNEDEVVLDYHKDDGDETSNAEILRDYSYADHMDVEVEPRLGRSVNETVSSNKNDDDTSPESLRLKHFPTAVNVTPPTRKTFSLPTFLAAENPFSRNSDRHDREVRNVSTPSKGVARSQSSYMQTTNEPEKLRRETPAERRITKRTVTFVKPSLHFNDTASHINKPAEIPTPSTNTSSHAQMQCNKLDQEVRALFQRLEKMKDSCRHTKTMLADASLSAAVSERRVLNDDPFLQIVPKLMQQRQLIKDMRARIQTVSRQRGPEHPESATFNSSNEDHESDSN